MVTETGRYLQTSISTFQLYFVFVCFLPFLLALSLSFFCSEDSALRSNGAESIVSLTVSCAVLPLFVDKYAI